MYVRDKSWHIIVGPCFSGSIYRIFPSVSRYYMYLPLITCSYHTCGIRIVYKIYYIFHVRPPRPYIYFTDGEIWAHRRREWRLSRTHTVQLLLIVYAHEVARWALVIMTGRRDRPPSPKKIVLFTYYDVDSTVQ